ncbi:MAG: preprotein translocase subunit SecG [Verrucomicrobiales bacterium]|nr:preprotein translocase subunit SecG [Verrucomicrobiales bacterium]
MSLLTVLLSIILVLNAAFLMLLILIQLPKKEAGAGLAFGAGATDALFGAGSGNALTKVTKYAATAFLALVLTLSILGQRLAQQSSSGIEMELKKRANVPSALPLPVTSNLPAPPSAASTNATTNSNLLKMTAPLTNAASPAATPPGSPAPTPTTPPFAPPK